VNWLVVVSVWRKLAESEVALVDMALRSRGELQAVSHVENR
jgi:hypothetical protein